MAAMLASSNLTMGSSTPASIHFSFFCTWPTMSFLRVRRADSCSCRSCETWRADRMVMVGGCDMLGWAGLRRGPKADGEEEDV